MSDYNEASLRAAAATVAGISEEYAKSDQGETARRALYGSLYEFFQRYDQIRSEQIKTLEKLALDVERVRTTQFVIATDQPKQGGGG